METRIFNRPVAVLSTDGNHSELFSRGERVRNIKRVRQRVMFEPVNTNRVAGTYAMDWDEFISKHDRGARGAGLTDRRYSAEA